MRRYDGGGLARPASRRYPPYPTPTLHYCSMQQKGLRYKTEPLRFWFRLCLKLRSNWIKPQLQLRDHDDLDARLDIAVDLDGDLVGA
jgi:hypothetical protein